MQQIDRVVEVVEETLKGAFASFVIFYVISFVYSVFQMVYFYLWLILVPYFKKALYYCNLQVTQFDFLVKRKLVEKKLVEPHLTCLRFVKIP